MTNPINTQSTSVAATGTNEVQIARIRRHARFFTLPAIALIVIAFAAGFWGNAFSEGWLIAVFWIGLLVALVALCLFPFIFWLGNRVIITSRRIVIYRGGAVRSRQEILFSRVHDVTIRQNAIQVMFGSGDLLINTGAERSVRIQDVPQASLTLSAMTDLVAQQEPLAVTLRRENHRYGTGEV